MRTFRSVIFAAALLALSNPSFAQNGRLLAIDWLEGDIYEIDTQSGNASRIFNTSIFVPLGMAFSPDGFLYVATADARQFQQGGEPPLLYRIDISNEGSIRPIQLIGEMQAGIVFEGGMTFAPDGTLWCGLANSSQQPFLMKVDVRTGVATRELRIFDQVDLNGLAWRSDGMLIGFDEFNEQLITIDLATGNTGLVGSLPSVSGFLGGLAAQDDQGYLVTASQAFGGQAEVWEVDLFTGQFQRIGSYGSQVFSSLSGATIVPNLFSVSPPEPGVAGQVNHVNVNGLDPFTPVALLQGLGPGRTPLGSCFVDLNLPGLIGSRVTNSAGRTNFVGLVPAGAQGKTVWYQAYQPSTCRLSNRVSFTLR